MPEPDENGQCPVGHDEVYRLEGNLVGSTVNGRYEVESLLSMGGFGCIYVSWDKSLKRKVAIKVMHTHHAANMEYNRRFQKEIMALSGLTHPNIAAIYDCGELPDGQPFAVMELVQGRGFDVVLERDRNLRPSVVIEIAKQICSALAATHSNGIIHRDIKPSNVLLIETSRGPTVKLVDFGLVKAFGSSDITGTGYTVGTPLYMSPEQATAQQVDARSDIYALGCVMYEALTGGPVFSARSQPECMVKHLSVTPTPISVLEPNLRLPAGLEALIMKMLEKDPAKRYQTANQVLSALESLDTATSPPSDRCVTEQHPGAVRPGAQLKYVLGGIACLLVIAGTLAIARFHNSARPTSTVQPPQPIQPASRVSASARASTGSIASIAVEKSTMKVSAGASTSSMIQESKPDDKEDKIASRKNNPIVAKTASVSVNKGYTPESQLKATDRTAASQKTASPDLKSAPSNSRNNTQLLAHKLVLPAPSSIRPGSTRNSEQGQEQGALLKPDRISSPSSDKAGTTEAEVSGNSAVHGTSAPNVVSISDTASAREVTIQAEKLVHSGNNRKAREIMSEPLQFFEKNGITNEYYVHALTVMADASFGVKDLKSTKTCGERALQIIAERPLSRRELIDQMNCTYYLGVTELANGDYAKAEKLIREAINLREKRGVTADLGHAEYLHTLAEVLHKESKPVESAKLFAQSADGYMHATNASTRAATSNANRVMDNFVFSVSMFAAGKDWQNCLQTGQKALDYAQGQGLEDEHVAKILDKMRDGYVALQDRTEALSCAKKAVDLWQRIPNAKVEETTARAALVRLQ